MAPDPVSGPPDTREARCPNPRCKDGWLGERDLRVPCRDPFHSSPVTTPPECETCGGERQVRGANYKNEIMPVYEPCPDCSGEPAVGRTDGDTTEPNKTSGEPAGKRWVLTGSKHDPVRPVADGPVIPPGERVTVVPLDDVLTALRELCRFAASEDHRAALESAGRTLERRYRGE